MQVRTSKFTRIPKGKLEVVLLEGIGLKYRNENYNTPIMEFKIDTQRVLVNEEIDHQKATWN